MKAILPKDDIKHAKNLARDKETVEALTVVALTKNEFKEPLKVKWYMGRSNNASVVYCSLWANGKNRYISGHGHAGGYGYHKVSAAFQDALSSAGIKLVGDPYGRVDTAKQCSVSGVGDSGVNRACKAVAKALGYRKVHITRS